MDVIAKLNAARQRVLNATAAVNEYRDYWGAAYAAKELSVALSGTGGFSSATSVIRQHELQQLPREVLYEYGFCNWDDKLVLIPLWLVRFMDGAEEVQSISGSRSTLASCDKDVRAGCIAWGFIV